MNPSHHVTVKQVALRAGVSNQTVSKVLSKQVHMAPSTEARIEEAIKILDCRPLYMARASSQPDRFAEPEFETNLPEVHHDI